MKMHDKNRIQEAVKILKKHLNEHHNKTMKGKAGGARMCECGQGAGGTQECGAFAVILNAINYPTYSEEYYVPEFNECPHCGGRDKDKFDVEDRGLEVRIFYQCEDCGEEFERVYEWRRNEK